MFNSHPSQKPNNLSSLDTKKCQELGLMLLKVTTLFTEDAASPSYPIGKVGPVSAANFQVAYNFALECPDFVFPKVGNT